MSKIDWTAKAQSINPETRAFINGEYVEAEGKKTFEHKSPIDGRFLPSISDCSARDIDNAVAIAKSTFEAGLWHEKPISERKEILFKFAKLIEEKSEELALLDCLSMGKAIDALYNNDVPLAVGCYRWFAEAMDKLYDECVPPRANVVGTITREPLGVVGCISPWNYPVENVAWKLGPALAAGNSVVLKPAEQCSYSAILLGALSLEAGIPKGVLNIVPGRGEITGAALALHNDVDGVFFTGSTSVGKKILEYSGQSNMKRVCLETGGKSPFVVLADYSDLPHAAKTLAHCIFYNQGQTCSAPSRLVIEESIHDEFLALLEKEAPIHTPQNPLLNETKVGALVSLEQLATVERYVKSGIDEGAHLHLGGERLHPVKDGAYYAPTIFTEVKSSMTIAQEEIFGPVLSVLKAKDVDDAITLANDSVYGLSAGIWTNNINLAHHVARKLRAGTVHINNFGGGDMSSPFGGYKQSGNGGKDKSLHALDDYSECKTTWLTFTPPKNAG